MDPEEARKLAVLNLDEGEEIAGMWLAPHIPNIGIYKLIAKKRVDGKIEWAHFVQRDDGRREKVYRGTVENTDELASVVQAVDKSLCTVYGPVVQLQPARAEMSSLDGKREPPLSQ